MPFVSRNVNLGPALRLSSWRKIAIGTWRTCGDPSVYGILEFDAGPALQRIEELRKETGMKITLSHFVGKAMANTFAHHPHLNCLLRFGKLYPRKTVDVFFQVATDPDGKDLSGITIREADKKTMAEMAGEMQSAVTLVREKGDPAFKKSKNMMKIMPGFLVGPMLNILGFILYSLNIWTPLFGAPRDSFGSMMITNVGSLGIDLCFAPLVAYSRVPLLIALGAVADRPLARNGQVVVAQTVQIGVTFDHRLIDGLHGSKMTKTLGQYFKDPKSLL
jgi:pyruvate/2-oxoglutarate dehydrogenase complex dihydrolipoamide acyltransferase (E2) component